MIGVIDYRTGNSQSVSYALAHLGVEHRLVARADQAEGIDRYVLPGVGSARVTMDSLAEDGWVEHLTAAVQEGGAPFLGICVGLQVLFSRSEEDGGVDCLGWIPGEVRRFDSSAVRVPHIGWNTLTPRGSHPLTRALGAGRHVYYVNSYYATATDPSAVAALTDYQVPFTAAVARGNVMATQFHTEKSGPVGLRVLQAFAGFTREELDGAR